MYKPNSVGEVIAQRAYRLIGSNESRIILLIGLPRRAPDADDYFCPYQIAGIGSEKVRAAFGVDAVQALQLALVAIPAELDALNRREGGKLRLGASPSVDDSDARLW